MSGLRGKLRFRFSLRSLLGLVLLVSLGIFAMREHYECVRLARRVRQLHDDLEVRTWVHEHRAQAYTRVIDGQQQTIDSYKRKLSTQS